MKPGEGICSQMEGAQESLGVDPALYLSNGKLLEEVANIMDKRAAELWLREWLVWQGQEGPPFEAFAVRGGG